MGMVLVLIGSIITIVLVYYLFEINFKKIKKLTENERINKLVEKFPNDEQVCKTMLDMLENNKVKIKKSENKKDKTSVYVAITDTIIIGNLRGVHTRIQTIAHECLHSIQSRKLLLFNFVFTNIYNLYFIITTILTILGILKNTNIQITILLLMGFLYYIVRSYLEIDAMINAKYLADEYMKEYIQNNGVCTINEVNDITKEHERINKLGIPAYIFSLFFKVMIKMIIYIIIVTIVMSGQIG